MPAQSVANRQTKIKDGDMTLSRLLARLVTGVGALAFALATVGTAHAIDWPTRPIHVIVPSSPGGSPDQLARLICKSMAEELGQPMIVDPLTGAAGIIGMTKASQAPNDGYTIVYGYNQVATMNPPLYPKLPYNIEKDFIPVGLTLNLTYMWIAPLEFPPNNIKELIALMKAKPGTVNYASTGPGSAAHLGGILLEKETGTTMTHVPYRGNTNSDLMGGVVQLKLDPIAASLGLAKSGKVKVLAVSSKTRSPVLPDVPTVAETVPGYEMVGWHGFWVPAGTSPEIVRKLNAAMVKVIHSPDMQKAIKELGYEPLGTSSKEMADRIHKEIAEWTGIIKQANIVLDP
jgi:tripartite-type tricarboxylate transporter receptor subunit TctC